MNAKQSQPVILQSPHPGLRIKCAPITAITPRIKDLIHRLTQALLAYRQETGYGRAISAPQLGHSERLIVLELGAGPIALINPTITWCSQELYPVWDDCLSVPNHIAQVLRHRSISVRYQTPDGVWRDWEQLPMAMAELIQHEIDHLNGILMIDHAETMLPIENRPEVMGQTRPTSRLNIGHILQASDQIDPVFLNSPQYPHESLSRVFDCELIVKVETLNPIRSFKGRGADYFFTRQLNQLKTKPLVTASAGNWGQALAYACRKHTLDLTVFAAEGANPQKINAMRSFGAEVRLEGRDFDAAKSLAKTYSREIGGWFLEDGMEPAIAEGHGTMALELLKRYPNLHAILVPLGNGALLTGVGAAVKAVNPSINVIGVCAKAAPSMYNAWKGRAAFVKPPEIGQTIADGIDVREPIPEAVADMASLVDDVLLVSEEQLFKAIQLAQSHTGVILEPAGGAGIAALLAHSNQFKSQQIAVILTGSHDMHNAKGVSLDVACIAL